MPTNLLLSSVLHAYVDYQLPEHIIFVCCLNAVLQICFVFFTWSIITAFVARHDVLAAASLSHQELPDTRK